MFRNILLVFGIIMICSNSCFAARPLTVDDANVLQKGMELEISSDADPNDNIYNEIGLVTNFAIAPNFQLGLEKPFIHNNYHSMGSGDTTITAKYNLIKDWATKIAIKNYDGDEINGFGSELIEYSLTFIHGLSFDRLNVDFNLSYVVYDHSEWYSDEVQNNWNTGVSFKYKTSGHLTLVAEATKMIVKEYIDNQTENQILTRGGLIYEGFGFPVDLAFYSMPETGKHGGITLGITLPIEY